MLVRLSVVSRFLFGPIHHGVEVMSRFVYGPQYSGVVIAPDVLPDVIVIASPAGAVGRTATVTVPLYDAATSNPPIEIHACYVATVPDPAVVTPEAFLASVPDANKARTPVTGSGDFVITVPGVTAGTWVVQFVIEYSS